MAMTGWQSFRVTAALVAIMVLGVSGPRFAAGAEGTASAGLRERNIVRKALPENTEAIGLEYTVLKVSEGSTDGTPVDPASHAFRVGDSFRVTIRPQDDLYVYVFTEGPGGARACLLPESPDSPLLVKADARIDLPEGGDVFTFESPAGEEKLVVLATKEPNPDLDLLASTAFKGEAASLTTEDESAKAKEAVEGVRQRGAGVIRERGRHSDLVRKAQSLPSQAMLEKDPDADSPATEIIGVGMSEIIVDIPLRSRQ
jgi:hypothetical protein